MEGETDNPVSPPPGTETGNAVLPVVINTSGGGRETDNAVLTTTHSETGDFVSLGPTEGPNHLDGETGNAVPIPSDEATTVTEFFSNNPQRVPETQQNKNSKGRGKRKGKNWSGGRGSRTDTHGKNLQRIIPEKQVMLSPVKSVGQGDVGPRPAHHSLPDATSPTVRAWLLKLVVLVRLWVIVRTTLPGLVAVCWLGNSMMGLMHSAFENCF